MKTALAQGRLPASVAGLPLLDAQSLRNIIIGLGGKQDGYAMQSRFGIAVGSELMAILAVASDLADLKQRINDITVAFDRNGKPVTCRDLEVGNAMAAFMRNTINPTLMCTAEHNPCLVHAGPFANIAVGQSSIIADRVGLKLSERSPEGTRGRGRPGADNGNMSTQDRAFIPTISQSSCREVRPQ